MLGFRELVIVLLIVLVVFGTKRLISAGGDLGKAIQGFKKGMRDTDDEGGAKAGDKPADPAKLPPPGGDAPARDGDSQGAADRDPQGR